MTTTAISTYDGTESSAVSIAPRTVSIRLLMAANSGWKFRLSQSTAGARNAPGEN